MLSIHEVESSLSCIEIRPGHPDATFTRILNESVANATECENRLVLQIRKIAATALWT